jgi:hypothetical protein
MKDIPYFPNVPPFPLTRPQMRACAARGVPFQLSRVTGGVTYWRKISHPLIDEDTDRYRVVPGFTLGGKVAREIWESCDKAKCPRVQFQYWSPAALQWVETHNKHFVPRKDDRYLYRIAAPGMTDEHYEWTYKVPVPAPVYTPPADHFSTPEFNEAVSRVAKVVHHAANELTERQLIEAFTQALKAGEFQRHIWVSGNGQRVVYIPFAEKERLEGEIAALREQLNGTDRKG